MRTPHLPILLVALAACSERTAQIKNNLDAAAPLFQRTAVVTESEPLLVRRFGGSTPQFRTDTLIWADTATRGDTTFLSRGRAITTTAVLTDSQWIRLAQPALAGGIPFGLFGLWNGTRLQPNIDVFSLTYGGESPATLMARLALARSRGVKMLTAMTGGARANYLTNGVFDMTKWKLRMSAYNTAELRAAVARAVSEGTLIGNSVMDEPFNDGGPGNEGNSWGPKGTMSKARVDSMCGYARAIFPTLPQGVFQDYHLAADGSYRVCDFITSQYADRKGPLRAYRDSALALCSRDRHACSFSINVLDGGIQAPRARGKTTWAVEDCPFTTTGGRGTYFPNCRMTAAQVREAGTILGSAGCFLSGWRYDSAFVAQPENRAAFRDVVTTLAARPAASCIRT
jgi:hypothetical protein